MNLNELAKTVHAANAKWWQDVNTGDPIERNKGELLALIHSEISEGFDGEVENLMDDKLPHRKMGEVEQADAFIRVLDYAAGFGHDIEKWAEIIGISEFLDLSSLPPSCQGDVDIYLKLENHGTAAIHAQISRVLENERKGRFGEATAAIVQLLIYIAAYCEIKGYDLKGAFAEKMTYNATRRDHSHEARRIAGGKQF